MRVGLLIISHAGVGPSLLGAATSVIGHCPLPVNLLSAYRDSAPDELMAASMERIEMLDSGAGALILTDLYGSTPYNVAKKIIREKNAHLISGLNLPMLLRVLNYPDLPLAELSQKALSGGHDGIIGTTP